MLYHQRGRRGKMRRREQIEAAEDDEATTQLINKERLEERRSLRANVDHSSTFCV
jgi:hypothetical protein